MVDKFESLRNIGASTDGAYGNFSLGENSFRGRKELGETIRSAYSLMKHEPERYCMNTTGLSMNVTNAILDSMYNPNEHTVINGQKVYIQTNVGKMSYNDDNGSPCSTLHLIG